MIVFICVGTTKISGDCFGPLVGSYLQQKYGNNPLVKIYGDMMKPIHFVNIDYWKKVIEIKHPNDTKVIIDSALGKPVGTFWVSTGIIELGCGLQKRKKIEGDINIIAIVGQNHQSISLNWKELQTVPMEMISQMAKEIVTHIHV